MMIIRLVKMVGRMITVANIEKATIETLVITVIVVTVVVAAIIVLALRVNIVARVVIIAIVIKNWKTGRKSNNTSKSSSSVVVVIIIVILLVVAVAVVAVTIRTVLFHPFDLTIYPMCSRHSYQETLLHYMHSCIVTLEKLHAHSPPDSNKKGL